MLKVFNIVRTNYVDTSIFFNQLPKAIGGQLTTIENTGIKFYAAKRYSYHGAIETVIIMFILEPGLPSHISE